jgi:LPS-assembly protein
VVVGDAAALPAPNLAFIGIYTTPQRRCAERYDRFEPHRQRYTNRILTSNRMRPSRCHTSAARVSLKLLFSTMKEAMPLSSFRRTTIPVAAFFVFMVSCRAGQASEDAGRARRQNAAGEKGIATLAADRQSRVGKISYADGNVDIRYQNVRLRADRVEYNDETHVAVARGHVQLDYLTQHVEADQATYDLRSGRGTFHRVTATFAIQRRPAPTLLISPNPLYFEAAEAERIDDQTYKIHRAWVTVCRPEHPTWKFYAPEATVHLQRSVHLESGNFRIFSVPIVYLPFATFPASRQRQSGFLIPDIGNSSRKGYFFGDAYYWAPSEWMDATVGGTYLSKRGWMQNADLRMRPWENTKLDASYFGVIDRGLEQENGPPLKQGGHEVHFDFDALLPQGWRAVADLNQLTSLTFRLAFAETFAQAVNSEVRNTAFLTNNFHGFSADFAALNYKDFLNVTSGTSITLRTAPEARFGSVDQAPFRSLPLYFSFDSFADGVHRGDTVTSFQTDAFIKRLEIAPTVTMPLRWGPWVSLTPSFTLRSTRYSAQLQKGASIDVPFVRTTEEISIDLRPPAFDRVWDKGDAKWKHSVEPAVVYRYVNGVDDFARFIRFDEADTLTDTNEIQYGVTQRLFRKTGEDDAHQLLSWSVTQKYFFDPTFGGALVPGVRNVFQALDSLTAFAFADQPRHFSPIVSDLRVTPGGRYDAQLRVDYDTSRNEVTAIGTLAKIKPYRESFVTLAYFSTINLPPAQPASVFHHRSDQVRALVGYGDLNRPGWNTELGFSYDVTQKVFQDQVIQLGYNGSCCGVGLEYRRLSLGAVRAENRYSFVFRIANLGSAGNLRRQDKIF